MTRPRGSLDRAYTLPGLDMFRGGGSAGFEYARACWFDDGAVG